MTTDLWRSFNNLVLQNNRFVLTSHVFTDGDALGSAIALYRHLKRLNKDVHILIPGDLPSKYGFLGTNELVNILPEKQIRQIIDQSEVTVILDISSLDRLENLYEPVMKSPAIKVCIDHHPLRCRGIQLCIIDDKKIATAEMIYDYFRQFAVSIDQAMAIALYAAILSDSGGFRFKGTGSYTFAMASALVSLGVNPAEMYRRVFETGHHRQLKAWGELLLGMKQQQFLTYAVVTQDFIKRHNLELNEVDGLIDVMRKDGQTDVFAVFVEKAADEILVGLRSRNGCDVGKIAAKFGGGGHFHAAGFTGRSQLQAVIELTLEKILNVRRSA